MRGLITSVMKGFITLELICRSGPTLLRRTGDQKGISPTYCHHHFGDDPLHHPVLPHRRLGLGGGVGQMPLVASHADADADRRPVSWGPVTQPGWWTPSIRRLVSHRRQPSTVAAGYGSPPEIAGRTGAGVGFDVLTRPPAAR
jgi:hypothetical protein